MAARRNNGNNGFGNFFEFHERRSQPPSPNTLAREGRLLRDFIQARPILLGRERGLTRERIGGYSLHSHEDYHLKAGRTYTFRLVVINDVVSTVIISR